MEESSEYIESADHSTDAQLQGLEENAENLERLPLSDQQRSSSVETARDEHEKSNISAGQPAGLEESLEDLENADHINFTQLQDLEENAENLERCEAPTLSLPSLETPLYNALLDKLSTTGEEEVMEQLADIFIFDKLKFKQPRGGAEQPAQNIADPTCLVCEWSICFLLRTHSVQTILRGWLPGEILVLKHQKH